MHVTCFIHHLVHLKFGATLAEVAGESETPAHPHSADEVQSCSGGRRWLGGTSQACAAAHAPSGRDPQKYVQWLEVF